VIGSGFRFCRHAGPPISAASRFPGQARPPVRRSRQPTRAMARGLAHRPGPAVILFMLATGQAADDRYAQLTPARLPEAAAPPEVFWGARDAITADPHGHGTA